MSAHCKADMNATTRCAAVAIAICSWIALSNHCAFAAVAAERTKPQIQCAFHSKPAKQTQSSQLQCCKILRAVILAKDKAWLRNDAKIRDATLFTQTGVLFACSLQTIAPLLLDTGPPLGAFSFAELILQRTLPAHAPPLLA
jgi:hypothetical protein